MSSRFPDAIRRQQVVEFTYEGRSRSVEPHAVGYNDSGALTLHGWELSGGRSPGFRGFSVREIRTLTVTRRQFDGPRPDYAPDALPLQKIVCQL
jgi:predicted DNA-binding transcriptional regulator YafY